MALDLGLTTHQLLSTLDGVVNDATTRAQSLDDAVDRALVLQRRFNTPLRESFVAQGLMGQLPDVHLRRKWASGKRRISNASL